VAGVAGNPWRTELDHQQLVLGTLVEFAGRDLFLGLVLVGGGSVDRDQGRMCEGSDAPEFLGRNQQVTGQLRRIAHADARYDHRVLGQVQFRTLVLQKQHVSGKSLGIRNVLGS